MAEGHFLSSFIGSTSLSFPSASDGSPSRLYLGLSADTWGRIGVIVGLFSALYWPNLRRLWQKTNPFDGEANWGHAICVPIIGIYYLYVHREDIAAAGPQQFLWGRFMRPSRLGAGIAMIMLAVVAVLGGNLLGDSLIKPMVQLAGQAIGVLGAMVLIMDWSLAITFFGIGVYVFGIYPGQNDYEKDIGMVITLFGIVLMMTGPAVMKIVWFPIAFLICGIPWPGLVYSWIAGPLQVLAANVAVKVLTVTGVFAYTSGTKIIIMGNTTSQTRMLNVAEACAGMRSLMTFITVGGAVGFLSDRPLWQKITITVSAIPIAIFCNVMRVSGQGLLDHYVSQKLSESFAHQFVGMIMLVPAFFMILMVGYVLDKIFIEEVDDETEEPKAATTTVAPRPAPILAAPITAPVITAASVAPVAAPVVARTAPPAAKPAPKPAAPVAPKVAATPPRPAAIPPAAKPLPRPSMGAIRPPPVRRPPEIGPAGKAIRPPSSAPPPQPPRKPSSGPNSAPEGT
jgi:exosortase